ncbi:uncharacterized protein LOC135096644 isoform X2 [Scylla paramamosain]|uniref:uncharacterized protein LOC135096644 isoform X2 n=1 Tax=Scylla paramamosain TaxID=85552 RepID=UPI003082974B
MIRPPRAVVAWRRGLHPAHDTSIHAGRDLTPSMYPSPPLPPQPAHPRAPPTCWPLPCFTARPDGYSVRGVAASGRGSCHTPEGSSPPDHCHGPHTPERPPHAGGFPASPPGQMATQGVAAATPPRAPRPQTTASTTAPWCSTTAASVLPSPAAPRGARGAAHHPQTAVPPRSGAVHPPAAPHATPRAIPIPGGLRSPCRSPSPLGEVYPYERRGWGCAAREWEALTTTITAPRQSREIGRARAMGTLPLRQYLMTSTGFHKGEEQRVSPPSPLPLPQHPGCQVFGYSPSRVTADDDDATPTPSLSHPPPTPALTKPPPVTTTTTTTSDVTPHPTPPQTTGKVTGKACEVSQNELVKLSGLFKYHWNCSSEEEEEEVRECAKTLYSGAKEWREMRRNLKENRSRMTSDSRSP